MPEWVFAETAPGVAVFRAPDHSRRKFFGLRKIATRLSAEKLPKASDILMQLAHDEIRSIPADISFSGRLPPEANRRSRYRHRPTADRYIFRIRSDTEQELAEGSDVGVVTLKTERRLELETGKAKCSHAAATNRFAVD
jgi:hypothetical protein